MTHTIQELKDWYWITFIEWDKAVWLFSETKLSEKEILWMYPKAMDRILNQY